MSGAAEGRCESYTHAGENPWFRPWAEWIDHEFNDMPRCHECCEFLFDYRNRENPPIRWEHMFTGIGSQVRIV